MKVDAVKVSSNIHVTLSFLLFAACGWKKFVNQYFKACLKALYLRRRGLVRRQIGINAGERDRRKQPLESSPENPPRAKVLSMTAVGCALGPSDDLEEMTVRILEVHAAARSCAGGLGLGQALRRLGQPHRRAHS